MRITILSFLLIYFSTLQAQVKPVPEQPENQIKYLKNGALLIRLQTKTAAINALKARDRIEEAQGISETQHLENKETMFSFQQQFDFCPVYFFYAEDSKSVTQGKLDGILFDNGLNFIDAPPQQYLIGEFSETPNLKIEGLIILDHDMIALKSPFPYYQRRHHFISLFTYSKPQMVDQLNVKLQKTYCFYHCDENEKHD